MSDIVLELNNIVKKYGNRTIIDGLSLTVESGQVYGFLGPNGAGKTTTIKMIVGLISIDSGSIKINNLDIVKDHKKAMKHVGAIVENPDLYGYLSGMENIQLYSRLRDIKKSRIDGVIELVGLKTRINDKVKKYSLGMKQRLGLAIALLHKPKLLILDEPTNGLDPAGIRKLRDTLKELAHKENVAVFVSSHMLTEMQLMCDKVAIIDGGKIIKIDNINNLEKINNKYILTVSDLDKSLNILKNMCVCQINSNDLIIEYDDKISNIIKELVNNDIEIFSINSKEDSLEDEFLKITGGIK
ncbi:MAG: ABC transporter ATP-binding protein [Bacilli bacterium]|nr:ABC transporter ATP-binding protein [Tissierellia bacterium]MDD4706545.1 ABC transporter ATP-binding protein [Bacilli bacterium]